MASTPLVCGGLVALGLFLLQVIGVGTDYWLTIHTNLTGTSDFRAGLFEVCVDGSVKGNSSIECIHIPAGFYLNTIQGLCIIACVALFFNVIISVVGVVRSGHERLIVKYLSSVWLVAAGSSITAVLMFYTTQFNDMKTVPSLSSLQIDIKFGCSFYLAAVAGGGTLIAMVTMWVVARQMDVPTSAAPSTSPRRVPSVFSMHSAVAQYRLFE